MKMFRTTGNIGLQELLT